MLLFNFLFKIIAAFDLPLNQAVHLKLNDTFVINSVTHFGRNPFRLKEKSDDTLIKIEKIDNSDQYTIRIGRGLLCFNSNGLYEGELPNNTSDDSTLPEEVLDTNEDDNILSKDQPDHLIEDFISDESEIMSQLDAMKQENVLEECLWEIIELGDAEEKDPFKRLYKDKNKKNKLKDNLKSGTDFLKAIFSKKNHNQYEMLSADVPNFALDTLHRQPTLLELERIHSYLYDLRRTKRKIVIKQGETCFMGDTAGSCERTTTFDPSDGEKRSSKDAKKEKSDSSLENSYNEQAIFVLQTVCCEVKEAEKPSKNQDESTDGDDSQKKDDNENPDKEKKDSKPLDKDDAKIVEKYGEPGETVKPLLDSLKKHKKEKKGWKWPSWKGLSLPALCNFL